MLPAARSSSVPKKVYDTSVWNVAQERYFYDLRPEAIKPEHRNTGIDLQAVEILVTQVGPMTTRFEALVRP